MHARELIDSLDPEAAVASLDFWRGKEREATATIVAHLAVMERERIHLDMGYSSLYVYCTERLGYSPDCALKRMRAARVALSMPEILDDLESGALTLSSILVLARHLDGSGEARELLEAARGRKKREVETLVAERYPSQDSPRGMCKSRPVAPGLVRLEMVVSAELAAELERIRDLDRHRNPSGDVEAILGRALELFAAEVEKRKYAAARAPRPQKPEEQARETRRVPAEVRRQVHKRDGGQCTYVGSERVCGERAFVEFDHIQARAKGGEHSTENGAELCAAHNRRKAEREIGKDRMREHIECAREVTQKRREVESAMTHLGFSPAEARKRASHALQGREPGAPLEELLRAALAA